MKVRAFRAAFPYTIPIFAGFWFLALAYGILMNVNGFPFVYPMLMSLLIFGMCDDLSILLMYKLYWILDENQSVVQKKSRSYTTLWKKETLSMHKPESGDGFSPGRV